MKARQRSAVSTQVIGKKLKGDRLAQLQVVGAVDFAHTAAAQQADNAIAISQDGARHKTRIINGVVRARDRMTP
jgi:hypothetical protein